MGTQLSFPNITDYIHTLHPHISPGKAQHVSLHHIQEEETYKLLFFILYFQFGIQKQGEKSQIIRLNLLLNTQTLCLEDHSTLLIEQLRLQKIYLLQSHP